MKIIKTTKISKNLAFLLPDIPHLLQLFLKRVIENNSLNLHQYLEILPNTIASSIRKKDPVKMARIRCLSYPPT
jgi:hypothetical protein